MQSLMLGVRSTCGDPLILRVSRRFCARGLAVRDRQEAGSLKLCPEAAMTQTTAERVMTPEEFREFALRQAAHWLLLAMPDEATKEAAERLGEIYKHHSEDVPGKRGS